MARIIGLLLLATITAFAQSYCCDWQVVAIGGGEMAGDYRCGATAGQTAAGYMNSPLYQASIGFWQTDIQVGIKDEPAEPSLGPLVTRLERVVPNPFRSQLVIRYSLAAEGLVVLRVHDLTGRVVRTLVNARQQPGRYSLSWNGRDDQGRLLGNGVYFCKLATGSYRSTRKLVLTR